MDGNLGQEAEVLKYVIAIEAIKAQQSIQGLAGVIFEISKEIGVSFKSVQKALEEAFSTTETEELTGNIITKLDPAIKRTIADATSLARSLERATKAGKELANIPVSINSPIVQAGLKTTDAGAQNLVNTTLDSLAERAITEVNVALAKRAITQDSVNKADLEALKITQQLSTSMNERGIAENNVALANKKIAEGEARVIEMEAKALLTQERKLALENAETQAFRQQLVELKQLASVDAQRLQQTTRRASPFAEEVNSPQAELAMKKLAEAEKNLIDTSVPLTEAQKKTVQDLKDVASGANKAGQGFFTLANIARTAFGTFVAMAIFKVTTAISEFFTSTLKSASEFRSAMTELRLAESFLSKKGLDVSLSDFDAVIKELETKYKYLSKLEVTSLVGEVATAAIEFDFSPEQIFKVSDALAYVNTKLKLSGKEAVDAAHFMNALMDSRSNFFNGMGLNITEQLVKEKAIEMGLVKQGEELSKNVRLQASMALITAQTADKQGELNRQLEGTPLGNQLELQEEWKDASLEIGKAFLTVKDNLVGILSAASPELAENVVNFFKKAAASTNVFIDSLEEANNSWKLLTATFETSWPGLYKIFKFLEKISDFASNIEWAIKVVYSGLLTIATVLATISVAFITFWAEVKYFGIGQAFRDAGKNAALAWKDGWEKEFKVWNPQSEISVDNVHTEAQKPDWLDGEPTGDAPDTKVPTEETDLAKALDKMNQEILDAQVKMAQDIEDAAIDLGRKLLDIDAEYAKKRADAQRDYSKKVRDINFDYNKKVQEINASASESRQKAQNDALEKEAEFQNKMKELQENFLLSLEDALHSRDARQVLKLTKQYELDKLQAERKHALDMSSSAQDEAIRQKKFVADRQAAERDRQFKIAEAQRNYADKLADLKREESAERAAAKLANQRKIEDLQKANRDRMAIIAANLVNEFNLTKKGLEAILKLFRVYYGNGGYIQQVMSGMQTMMNTGAFSQKASSPSFQKPISGGFAEGGTVIANRPTSAIFGEAGLEMATFTPIGRKGQDVNKIFTSMSGMPSGNSGGAVSIELLLSPDLEARMVSNTLDKTADIVTKIRRSKG